MASLVAPSPTLISAPRFIELTFYKRSVVEWLRRILLVLDEGSRGDTITIKAKHVYTILKLRDAAARNYFGELLAALARAGYLEKLNQRRRGCVYKVSEELFEWAHSCPGNCFTASTLCGFFALCPICQCGWIKADEVG